jgi:hypothetical protein
METLISKLEKLPPVIVVDLLLTVEGLKNGAEILRRERNAELERIFESLGLAWQWSGGRYLVAKTPESINNVGEDPVSRGRWFGIPDCCIQRYQELGRERLEKELAKEELALLESGEEIPDEFYLGSLGYLPCSMRCRRTLERGMKAREILDRYSPKLWSKFRAFHIRRRLVEYGGEIRSWKRAS